jgi:NADPH:quinone reductase-like Zn-dependent oxidoreductase
MPDTMRAIVLDAPGPPEALQIRELPVPVPPTGWVLIKVKAFGLNRSELHTRLGLAEGVTFPRVLGIEATGVVAQCPGREFPVGQQVVAMMGGMGRTFDGGYAEYTCVPASQVIAFHSDLDWPTLGAVPEMLQTSYGSLTVGLDAQPGQSILIRGGTSSIGLATAILAKRRKMTVLSTTRSRDKVVEQVTGTFQINRGEAGQGVDVLHFLHRDHIGVHRPDSGQQAGPFPLGLGPNHWSPVRGHPAPAGRAGKTSATILTGPGDATR